MKSDLLQDAIGMVRDEYIEDAHADSLTERTGHTSEDREEKRKKYRKMFNLWKLVAGLCALFLLVFGLYKTGLVPFDGSGGGLFETAGEVENTTGAGDETGNETNGELETRDNSGELPGSEEAVGNEETEATLELPEIIWSEISESEDAFTSSSSIEEMLRVIAWVFRLKLEAAEETDVFAFVVGCKEDYKKDQRTKERLEELESTYRDAYNKMESVRQDRYWELRDGGMSSREAFARIYKYPVFAEWREKALAAEQEWKLESLTAEYEAQKDRLERFEELGFTLLYDASAEEYQNYLAALGGLGVFYGTKEQILALDENAEFRGKYWVRGAAENTEEYVFTDHYSGHEIYLSEGNYLTDPLIAAYEHADGQKLKVEVQMAYYGETLVKDEKHKAVLTYMGISQAEYEARCGDIEFRQQYLAAEKYVTSNRDYYEEVIQRLLKAEELAEEWDGGSSVFANLTYERALELAANKEIAYIELAANKEIAHIELAD